MKLIELMDNIDEHLMNWYFSVFDSDEMEEFVSYLSKCGFNKEQIAETLNNEKVFYECLQSFLSSRQ